MSPEDSALYDDGFLVHTSAPTNAAFDKIYREEGVNTLDFVPVRRINVGSISWPLKRAFPADEEHCEALPPPPMKRIKLDGNNSPQDSLLTKLSGAALPVPTFPPISPFHTPITPYRPYSVSEILVPQTGLHTLQKPSHILQHAELKSSVSTPPTEPRTPFKPTHYASQKELKEHQSLSQAFDSWCSDVSIPDSQPSQIPSSRVPPARPSNSSNCAETPCPAERFRLPPGNLERRADVPLPPLLPQLCSQTTPTSQSFPSEPPSELPPSQPHMSPESSLNNHPEQLAFPRLTQGPLLTFSTPAPNASSLEIPVAFSPVDASPLSISGLILQTPSQPPFDPICPLPTFIDPPYTIVAPCPGTSSNPPQAPSALYELVEKKLNGKFKQRQASQTREPRQWERGYWKIDMTSWRDPVHKANFWRHIKDCVLMGRLGMVMMCLETEEVGDTLVRWGDGWRMNMMDDAMERRGNVVRVYCWGGTMELVWCVLYIIAYRGMDGAVWIATNGEVVVRMV